MRIGFIGAGRAGTAIGIYLKQNGFTVSGYYSRSDASSLKAAEATESSSFQKLNELAAASDIIFITTTDNQIENACQELCQTSVLRKDHIIAHMSGAMPSTILSPAKAYGCCIYSLHPLLSFADSVKSAKELPNAYFCLEGDNEKISVFEDILNACGNNYFKLKPQQKVLYHASACMLSNYLVTLVHNGIKIMESIQIDSSTAFKAMLPLINSSLQNILEFGAGEALTGPISRGDTDTVAKQLDELQSISSEQLPLYVNLSLETLKLAKLSKLKKASEADKLESIIKSYL